MPRGIDACRAATVVIVWISSSTMASGSCQHSTGTGRLGTLACISGNSRVWVKIETGFPDYRGQPVVCYSSRY